MFDVYDFIYTHYRKVKFDENKELIFPVGDGIIPRCILLIALILLSGFFAAAETAFSSCNRLRLKRKAEEGDRGAQRANQVLAKFDKAVVTLLICINVLHVASSSVATVLAIDIMGPAGAVVSTIVMTLLVFFFSEMIPKNIAKANSDSVSVAFSRIIYWIMVVLTPISVIFTGMGAFIKKLIAGSNNPDPTMTEDEFQDIIETIEEEGMIAPEESDLIQSAVEFGDIMVEDIITPRVRMVGLNVEASQEEMRKTFLTEKYSRLPVYEGSIDNIIGILQVRSALKIMMEGKPVDIRSLMTPPYFVRKNTTLDYLFENMSKSRTQAAIVIDDYNGTLGMVTIEDIVEELVGDIMDEDDVAVPSPVIKKALSPKNAKEVPAQ